MVNAEQPPSSRKVVQKSDFSVPRRAPKRRILARRFSPRCREPRLVRRGSRFLDLYIGALRLRNDMGLQGGRDVR
jgi:hypothetical protein